MYVRNKNHFLDFVNVYILTQINCGTLDVFFVQ